LFLAKHSFGGRHWVAAEARTLAEMPDPSFESYGADYVIIGADDAIEVELTSAYSGSMLLATKKWGDTWDIVLEVPIGEDGKPYEGVYWSKFHSAVTPKVEQNV
jgi:hypothetical protein